MQHRDQAYIWDMIHAAKDIVEFTEGLAAAYFDKDKKTRYAVERQLLVIGEAANHISDETKKQYPEIPWQKLVGLRNIIAHEYVEVLTERIWNVCKYHIPLLTNQLENILPD